MLFVTKNNKRHFQYFEKVLDARQFLKVMERDERAEKEDVVGFKHVDGANGNWIEDSVFVDGASHEDAGKG